MEALKRVLIVMVIILVLIVGGGGLYLASMGGMNHGQTPDSAQVEGQNQEPKQEQKQEPKQAQNQEAKQEQGQEPSKDQADAAGEAAAKQGQIVIQVPVQKEKTDPSVYINQIKEKLKSVNETNSSVALNSGQHNADSQPGGSSAAGQGNMNQLHEDFYQLGKDIAAMEYSIDSLSNSLNNQPAYYQYQVPDYGIPSQPGGQGNGTSQAAGQNHDTSQAADQNHGTSQANSHGGTGLNLFNVDTIKLVLNLVLLASILFGIVAVIGFVGSLFKGGQGVGNGQV